MTTSGQEVPCPPFPPTPPSSNLWIIGIKNAAVFPDPVCAQPITSLPASTMGKAYFWTGVGDWYFDLAMFAMISGSKLASVKVSHFSGTSSPVTLTGIFSYFEKFIPLFTPCKYKFSSRLSSGTYTSPLLLSTSLSPPLPFPTSLLSGLQSRAKCPSSPHLKHSSFPLLPPPPPNSAPHSLLRC